MDLRRCAAIGTIFTSLVVAGCGSVNTAADAPTSPADARSPDAPPAGRCDPKKPFGAPVLVDGINTAGGPAGEAGASLTPDELTIYFASNRLNPGTPDFDIYVATRASTSDAFDAGQKIAALDLGGDERSTWILPDALTIYIYSSAGTGGYDLFVATRASTSAPFGTPQPLGVNTAEIEEGGAVTGDGKTLYFQRGTAAETYRSINAGAGFATATAVAELNGPDADAPIPSPDDLTIYFASARAGGMGGPDIYMATRPSTSDAFNQITNLTSLNSTEFDVPSWVSPDGCVMYLTSLRGPGFEVWSAARPL